MLTGYWMAEDPFESLSHTPIASPFGDAGVFLHGLCGIFAIALHEIFGYELSWVLDDLEDDEEDGDFDPWRHLVHIYCEAESGDEDAYIDVRGITTDEETFFDEFRDFFTEGSFGYGLPVDTIRDRIIEDMSEEEYAAAYEIAKELIHKNESYYKTEKESYA